MNENEERNINFEHLKQFFKTDMKIKNLLMRISPEEMDDYNEKSRIEYIDNLYKQIKDLEEEFKVISKNFNFGEEVDKVINEYFSKLKQKLLISQYNKGVNNSIYENNFSNMSEELIEEVKNNFVGYTLSGTTDLARLIKKANSINELLHIFHSYITNSEKIMESMPIIETKENEYNYAITLYGEETNMARKIFEDFPENLDVGNTDIVAIQGKTLMMVRDRGHALTIDIEEGNKSNIIRYFVPKICNRDMIEKLPGINKISQNCATGAFEISKEEISEKLFSFIGKIPMDYDMPEIHNYYTQNEVKTQFENTQKEEEQQFKQPIFGIEDAKEVAMEVGEKGRTTSSIIKIKDMIKQADLKKQILDEREDR